MSTYEELQIILTTTLLIVAILTYTHRYIDKPYLLSVYFLHKKF